MKYSDIPILMYHQISEINNPWCVSPKDFTEQMLYLHENGYQTINLNELKAGIDKELETDKKLVVITFDDAREGVFTQAYPILKKFGFTATIYVVPQWVESDKIKPVNLGLANLKMNLPEQENYSGFLSWEELKQLSEEKFEIGSHTYSHQNLTKLNEMGVVKELDSAKDEIEKNIEAEVNHLSYPFGEINDFIINLVNKKYKTAVTVKRGFGKSQGKYARQGVLKNTSLEEFKKILTRPRLSLCMIVRDEEKFLGQCLDSVKELVDEMIIVDTGSTDQTKDIAARFGAKIFDFTWNDNFSAARNESLKYAAGDWILVLDADETIDKKAISTIKEAINNWNISGFRIMTRNYSHDSSVSGWQPCDRDYQQHKLGHSFQGWYPSIKVRLFQNNFQNKNKIKFVGKMHEMVEKTIEDCQGQIMTLNATIHHYGALKSGSEKNQKMERYLKLTRKKIKEDPHNAKTFFELGVQQKELGDFHLAERSFQQSLKIDPEQPWPLLNLALVQQKQEKLDSAIVNYKKILGFSDNNKNNNENTNNNNNNNNNNDNDNNNDNGKSNQSNIGNNIKAEAHFGLGYCFFKKNELHKALEHFQQATFNNSLFLDAYVNLGAIYEKLDLFPEALATLKKALTINPKSFKAYYNLGVIHERNMNLVIAMKCYQKAVQFGHPQKEELTVRIEKLRKIC